MLVLERVLVRLFIFSILDFEIQTPLKVYPFAFMDGTLKDYMELDNDASLAKILALKENVKKVNGTFISLFHNETLSETEHWAGWKTIYLKMMSN